jgi:hypothetical protein
MRIFHILSNLLLAAHRKASLGRDCQDTNLRSIVFEKINLEI